MKFIWFVLALPLCAQNGHWEGVIRQEGRDALFSVDMDGSPDWRGSFEVPGSNAPPLVLADIRTEDTSISFDIPDLPGAPNFKGLLGENGANIRGIVTQAGRTVAFEMRRTGEPHVKLPPANTPIGGKFVGEWTGSVKLATDVRLILRLHAESGTLDTADGQAKNLLLSAIMQSGDALTFDVRLIGGHFAGKLSEDSARIDGTWTQEGRIVPLIFIGVPK